MAGAPPSPPGTPKSSARGVRQGPVNNSGAQNNNVVTGNVYGYNVIVGKLDVTVAAATTLTDGIRDFTARAAILSRRLKAVADKVGATSAVLSNIRDLVVKQAEREGITITEDSKGHVSSDGDKGASAGGGPGNAGEEPDILETRCFKGLREACEVTKTIFEDFTQRIRDASDIVFPHQNHKTPDPHLGTDRGITEDVRERMSLSESDIDEMEHVIESHKSEMQIAFTVFQAVLNDEKNEFVKRTVLSIFKYLKLLADHPPGHGHRPPYPPKTLPDLRPLIFPDLSRLTSIYMGWTFRKIKPSDPMFVPGSSRSSWEATAPTKMAFSTEELFLEVLKQIASRAKLNRTLQDDYKELSRSRSKRKLIDDFLRYQNAMLQRDHHLQLEWTLAGLECVREKKSRSIKKTRKIKVILKTQWVPGYRPGNLRGGPADGGLPVGGGSPNAIPDFDEPTYLRPLGYRPRSRVRLPRHRPPAMVREPQFVFVKEGGNATKRARKDGRDRERNSRRHSQVFVELRHTRSYHRGSSDDTSSSSSHSSRPSSPDIFIGPPRRPAPGPPPPPPPDHHHERNYIRVVPGPSFERHRRGHREEMTPAEERRVVEKLFDEWEELADKKGKKKRKETAHPLEGRGEMRDHRAHPSTGDDSDVGVVRSLMRTVERESQHRRTVEETMRNRESIRAEVEEGARVRVETERMRHRERTRERLGRRERARVREEMERANERIRHRHANYGRSGAEYEAVRPVMYMMSGGSGSVPSDDGSIRLELRREARY